MNAPTRPRPCRILAALLIALVACGGGGAGDDDAPSDGDGGGVDPCAWPVETSTRAGTIELGTGAATFEPMPDELAFIIGTQGGTLLILNARIKDLEPGNPDDFLDPRNPRTRFSATLFDGTAVGRECPSTQGYKPRADGTFERKQYQSFEFLPFSLGAGAFDTTVKLKVEIIDVNGNYASDEKDVFCRAPDLWPDAGPGDEDAGPELDAGPADAAPDADAR